MIKFPWISITTQCINSLIWQSFLSWKFKLRLENQGNWLNTLKTKLWTKEFPNIKWKWASDCMLVGPSRALSDLLIKLKLLIYPPTLIWQRDLNLLPNNMAYRCYYLVSYLTFWHLRHNIIWDKSTESS